MANKIYEHLKLDDQGRVDAEFLNVYQSLNEISGTAGVSSFNTRTGVVNPADGDYSKSLITGLKDADSVKFATLTASNLIDSGLTASRIVVTDANKQFTSSIVTSTELGYLSGATSAIQTQLNGKLAAARGNHKVFYSDGTGTFQELALGVAGSYLKSTGTTSAPEFVTASGSGDVIAPAANTADYIPQWNGANSKTLKDGINPTTIPTISSGAGAPASTPGKVGDIYIDTTNKIEYMAFGISASTDWYPRSGTDSTGAYRLAKINTTLTKVYTKYLTGTLDNDSATSVAHGISDVTKILSCVLACYDNTNSFYRLGEIRMASNAGESLAWWYDTTNVQINDVGANYQGRAYRIKMDYYL